MAVCVLGREDDCVSESPQRAIALECFARITCLYHFLFYSTQNALTNASNIRFPNFLQKSKFIFINFNVLISQYSEIPIFSVFEKH